MHDVYLCVHTGHDMSKEIRGQLCGAILFSWGESRDEAQATRPVCQSLLRLRHHSRHTLCFY